MRARPATSSTSTGYETPLQRHVGSSEARESPSSTGAATPSPKRAPQPASPSTTASRQLWRSLQADRRSSPSSTPIFAILHSPTSGSRSGPLMRAGHCSLPPTGTSAGPAPSWCPRSSRARTRSSHGAECGTMVQPRLRRAGRGTSTGTSAPRVGVPVGARGLHRPRVRGPGP